MAGIPEDKLRRLQRELGSIQIVLPKGADPHPSDYRSLFTKIRDLRNVVERVLDRVAPKLAYLRADFDRVSATLDDLAALELAEGNGLAGKTMEIKKAKVRARLESWYEAKRSLQWDVRVTAEVVSTAMRKREELRFAFEEASRALASVEMERKLIRSEP